MADFIVDDQKRDSASAIDDVHPDRTHGLPAMLTAKQVAALLMIQPPVVYKMARSGTIPCVRVGRSVRFNRDRLLAWIEAGGSRTGEAK